MSIVPGGAARYWLRPDFENKGTVMAVNPHRTARFGPSAPCPASPPRRACSWFTIREWPHPAHRTTYTELAEIRLVPRKTSIGWRWCPFSRLVFGDAAAASAVSDSTDRGRKDFAGCPALINVRYDNPFQTSFPICGLHPVAHQQRRGAHPEW
jgi:hypothetical protein